MLWNVGKSYLHEVISSFLLNAYIRLCFRRKVAHVSPHCPICNLIIVSNCIRLGFRRKASCSGSLRQAGVLVIKTAYIRYTAGLQAC